MSLEQAIKSLQVFLVMFIAFDLSWSEDLASCTLKKTPDEMNYCKASFAGSGTFCDQIKNGELKRSCYFMVIKKQRDNTYSVRKPEVKKTEEEKPAAEHH